MWSPTPLTDPCRLQYPLRRQDAGSGNASHLVELTEHYRQVARRERQGAAVDGAPNLRKERMTYVGHASPYHDQRRVERTHQRSQHPSNEPPGLTDDLERPVVSEARRLSYVPRAELSALSQRLREDRG